MTMSLYYTSKAHAYTMHRFVSHKSVHVAGNVYVRKEISIPGLWAHKTQAFTSLEETVS